jgi:hypothetical protein
MIGGFFTGSALAIAETADKRASRVETPVDEAGAAKSKLESGVLRVGGRLHGAAGASARYTR